MLLIFIRCRGFAPTLFTNPEVCCVKRTSNFPIKKATYIGRGFWYWFVVVPFGLLCFGWRDLISYIRHLKHLICLFEHSIILQVGDAVLSLELSIRFIADRVPA
jgi:hypothetical protein